MGDTVIAIEMVKSWSLSWQLLIVLSWSSDIIVLVFFLSLLSIMPLARS